MRKTSAGLVGLLIAAVLVVLTPSAASAACDYTDAGQNGGWGWDPVARTSCPPQETPDEPEPSDDEPAQPEPSGYEPAPELPNDGDFDELIPPNLPIPPPPPAPTVRWCPTDPAGLDYDSDGDGWGWRNGSSCEVQFPRAYDPALEDRVAAAITHGGPGVALSEAEKRQVAARIVSAYGHRPDLIAYWDDKATRMSMIDPEPQDDGTNALGWNRCHHYGWDNWQYKKFRGHMALSNTSEFVVVHEFAHAIDCSDRSGRVDGIGLGMSGAEQSVFIAERQRLFAEWNRIDRGELSSDRVAGLRFYAFRNNVEFFAEATEIFLGRDNGYRITMAQQAPDLYETLRSYYNVEHWPTAAEVEAPTPLFPRIPDFDPDFDLDEFGYASL